MIAIIDGSTSVSDYGYVLEKLDHVFRNQEHVTILTNKLKKGACKLAALYATLTNNCQLNMHDCVDADDIIQTAKETGEHIGIVLFGADVQTPDFTNAAKEGIRVVQLPVPQTA